MKQILPLVLLFSLIPLLPAQISVAIRSTHTGYLLYNSIFIRMNMRNYSGHPIAFGNTEKLRGQVEFRIFDRNNRLIPPRDTTRKSLLSNFILESGQSRMFTFDLMRYYQILEPGEYRVRAIIGHPQLGSQYQSNEVLFSVQRGVPVQKIEFGLPDYAGKNKDKIRSRTLSILKFSDNRTISYYMLLEDARQVYKIKRFAFDFGPNLKPQVEVDSMAQIHILAAASPRVFVYFRYDQDGVLKEREVYIRTRSTPFMIRNPKDSSILIDGGRIARKDIDYEELKELPILDEVKEDSDNLFDTEKLPDSNPQK